MKIKNACIIVVLSLAHIAFLILAYNAEALSTLSAIGDVVIISRILILLQFIPLVIILVSREKIANTPLLFLAFAIGINTMCTMNDFYSGFYGALIDHETGIVPRMRTSVHMMAYRDTGHLAILDYHAEFFHEFILVHILSEITNLDYIFTYFFAIRILYITLYSAIFVMFCNVVKKHTDEIGHVFSLILVASMFMASGGEYNYEISFGKVLLAAFLCCFIVKYQKSAALTIIGLLLTVGIILASFRDTFLLLLMSIVGLCAYIGGQITHHKSLISLKLLVLLMVIILARVLEFSTLAYPGVYVITFINFITNLKNALLEEPTVRENPVLFATLPKGSQTDIVLALLSSYSVAMLLTILAIMSLLSLYSMAQHKRTSTHNNPFFYGILVSFLSMFIIMGARHIILLKTGVPYDRVASLSFPATLAPAATLVIDMCLKSQNISRRVGSNIIIRRALLLLLSIIILFVPLSYYTVADVKISSDVLRVSGVRVDRNEYMVFSNSVYLFVNSYVQSEASVAVDPYMEYYHFKPLQYTLGKDHNSQVFLRKSIPAEGIHVFNNGVYTILYNARNRCICIVLF